ncbi:MAG TPA: GNAT family protein [Steroidobacter sp.]
MSADAVTTVGDEAAAKWSFRTRTRDGTEILVRPLRPDDRRREIDFIESLSERTRYLRLLTPLRYLPPHLLDQLMDIDYDRRMALVATVGRNDDEKFIGIARYGEAGEPGVAEFGITVTDEWQRRGVATILLRELLKYAAARGWKRMVGLVLPENYRMLALARNAGFTVKYDPDEHLMRVSCDLAPFAPVANVA